MGVPQPLRSEILVTVPPATSRSPSACSCWSPGPGRWRSSRPRPRRCSRRTGSSCSACCRQGEEVDCGCFGALGDDRVSGTTLARNSLLVVLAALATAFGAAGSGVVPALGDFGTADWWWLVAHGRGGGNGSAGGGAAPVPEAVIDDDDLLDYDRVPDPLRRAGGRVRHPHHAAAAGRRAAPAAGLPERYCGACETVAWSCPAGCLTSRPRRDLDGVHRDLWTSLPETMLPDGIPAWFDVESGATRHASPHGRPSAVLLGADGSLAGGPVARCQRRGDVRRGHRGRAGRRTGAARGTVDPGAGGRPSAATTTASTMPGHGSDDGHGHA